MVLYFKTKKLQKICNNTSEAVKKLGPKMARKLQQRLMELKAASCLDDIYMRLSEDSDPTAKE